jgi:hypothetical protein
VIAACETNAPPFSTVRSAMSSSETAPSARIEQRRPVDGDRAADRDDPQVVVEDDHHERHDHREQCQGDLDAVPGPARQQGLEDDAHAGRPEEDQHRRERGIADRGQLEFVHG